MGGTIPLRLSLFIDISDNLYVIMIQPVSTGRRANCDYKWQLQAGAMQVGRVESGEGGKGEWERGGMGEWEHRKPGGVLPLSHSPTLPLSHSPILPFSHSPI